MPATLCRGAFFLAIALSRSQAEERIFGPKELLSEMLQRNPEIQAARFSFSNPASGNWRRSTTRWTI